MKLLVAAESLEASGGWGSYSRGLTSALAGLGVEIRALVDRRAGATAPPGVEVRPCLTSPLAALIRPAAMAWNLGQLLRQSRGMDLLHFMVEPYATASFPVGLPPSIVTLHGTYAVSPFREGRLTRTLYASALRRARTVICVSRFTQDALQGKLRLDNTEVIHNGHAVDRNGPAEEVLVEGGPLILTVGALKPRKGYHVALRAVARLRTRFPELRYYLVGDLTDRKYVEALRQQIAELGLQKQAVIVGPVSEGRLRALYRKANLFLLTPVNLGHSFEGFGIAYLEANAFGKPVIGSLGCGAEEAIEQGVNGLLAPQNDDAAIAECAARILEDPALAARLGAAGRARAALQAWHGVAQWYLAVYEQALSR